MDRSIDNSSNRMLRVVEMGWDPRHEFHHVIWQRLKNIHRQPALKNPLLESKGKNEDWPVVLVSYCLTKTWTCSLVCLTACSPGYMLQTTLRRWQIVKVPAANESCPQIHNPWRIFRSVLYMSCISSINFTMQEKTTLLAMLCCLIMYSNYLRNFPINWLWIFLQLTNTWQTVHVSCLYIQDVFAFDVFSGKGAVSRAFRKKPSMANVFSDFKRSAAFPQILWTQRNII